MLTNSSKLRLKDVASRIVESSGLLPEEERFLNEMAWQSGEARDILEKARQNKLRDCVSGE